MDVLARIKRLVSRGDVVFTEKAEDEMEADGLFREDVIETILGAERIDKVLKSRSPRRLRAGEKLYVIIGFDSQGTPIYTKGVIRGPQGQKVFYILVSAKLASRGA